MWKCLETEDLSVDIWRFEEGSQGKVSIVTSVLLPVVSYQATGLFSMGACCTRRQEDEEVKLASISGKWYEVRYSEHRERYEIVLPSKIQISVNTVEFLEESNGKA